MAGVTLVRGRSGASVGNRRAATAVLTVSMRAPSSVPGAASAPTVASISVVSGVIVTQLDDPS